MTEISQWTAIDAAGNRYVGMSGTMSWKPNMNTFTKLNLDPEAATTFKPSEGRMTGTLTLELTPDENQNFMKMFTLKENECMVRHEKMAEEIVKTLMFEASVVQAQPRMFVPTQEQVAAHLKEVTATLLNTFETVYPTISVEERDRQLKAATDSMKDEQARILDELMEKSDEYVEVAPGVYRHAIRKMKKALGIELSLEDEEW